MLDITEIIGFIAAALGVMSFIPQVLKVWKSRSAEGISTAMYIIYCVSVSLWVSYGIMIGSYPIIIANLLVFIFALSILTMKLLWK